MDKRVQFHVNCSFSIAAKEHKSYGAETVGSVVFSIAEETVPEGTDPMSFLRERLSEGLKCHAKEAAALRKLHAPQEAESEVPL